VVAFTVLRGGRVYAPGVPGASALLVGGDGRIAWIGRDDDAPDVSGEVVELDGAWVLPGFVDAHVHATSAGLALTGLDLSGARSLSEALARVASFAAGLASDAVVLGHGWDETRWPEGRAPYADELGVAAGGRRLYLSRADVHSAVVSPALLARVPEVRAADGFGGERSPVSRQAHHLVRRAALGAVTVSQRRAAQLAALRRAAAVGVVAVHECAGPDISGEEDFAALLALGAAGGGDGVPLPRVVGYWGELAELGGVERARGLGAVGAAGDLFVDGAVGSRTALLAEPYADAAGCGAAYLTVDQIAGHVRACTRVGMQAGFHAIGDAALRRVAEACELVAAEVGVGVFAACRHRVEHVELVDAELVGVFARLGVVASVQPAFDAFWGGPDDMYVRRLGGVRAAAMNPFAALHGAGVRLAFGSDAPVTPVDPWAGVRAAVWHRTVAHRVPVEVALAAHAAGGWFAAGAAAGAESGVLRVGAPASYAVFEGAGDGAVPWVSAEGALPVCLRAALAGQVLFDAAAG
jgi:predicted amidohydrolase YtcJ